MTELEKLKPEEFKQFNDFLIGLFSEIELTPETLLSDLKFDDLDMVESVIEAEILSGVSIEDNEWEKKETVGNMYDLIVKNL